MPKTYKKALLFGSFDTLHPGHSFVLEKALELAEKVYIALAEDQTIQRLKGKDPKNPWQVRKQNLENLYPSVVVIPADNKEESWAILEQIKPEVVILGYDQTTLGEALNKYILSKSLPLAVVTLPDFHGDKFHSSKM